MVKEAYLPSRPRHTLIDLHKVEISPMAGCMEVSSVFLQIIYFEKNIVLVSGRLRSRLKSGAPNENIVQNHLNMTLLNVF